MRLICDSHVFLILVSTVSPKKSVREIKVDKTETWESSERKESKMTLGEKRVRNLGDIFIAYITSCKTNLKNVLLLRGCRLFYFFAVGVFIVNGQDSGSRNRRQLDRWELNRSRKVPLAGIWTHAVWGVVVPLRRCATHKAMARLLNAQDTKGDSLICCIEISGL